MHGYRKITFKACKISQDPDMKKILIAFIYFYKKYISPFKGTKCPYYPSCSDFAVEALDRYGVIKGSFIAFWRIIRCNPFSKGGIDPVNDRIFSRYLKLSSNSDRI